MKKSQDYFNRERLEKLWLTPLLEIRMIDDQTETFKIMIKFLIMEDIFSITLFEFGIYLLSR